MKPFLKFIGSFLLFCMLASFAATALEHDVAPALTFGVLLIAAVASALKKKDKSVHVAGVATEVWVDYIMKRFWKDNSFLKSVYSDDAYVVKGKTVHIPQPGSLPTVTKNPSSFPLSATQRTDTEISYDLDFYVSAPCFITSAEEQEVSYDKMNSIIGDHVGAINQRAADELLITWSDGLPGANVIYTSGASTATLITGQTGTRKAMTYTDVKAADTAMNNADVPQEGRSLILTANALQELTDSMTEQAAAAFRGYYDPTTGRIGRLFSFDVYYRSSTAVAAAALSGGNLAVNAYGTATGATDLAICIAYHRDSLARAMGEIKFYEQVNAPQYAGDVYNASIRFGGRRRRSDDAGVIVIAQGT